MMDNLKKILANAGSVLGALLFIGGWLYLGDYSEFIVETESERQKKQIEEDAWAAKRTKEIIGEVSRWASYNAEAINTQPELATKCIEQLARIIHQSAGGPPRSCPRVRRRRG
jgi:hypothetical protein